MTAMSAKPVASPTSGTDLRAMIERHDALGQVVGSLLPCAPGADVAFDILSVEEHRLYEVIFATPTTDRAVIAWELRRIADLLDDCGPDPYIASLAERAMANIAAWGKSEHGNEW